MCVGEAMLSVIRRLVKKNHILASFVGSNDTFCPSISDFLPPFDFATVNINLFEILLRKDLYKRSHLQ